MPASNVSVRPGDTITYTVAGSNTGATNLDTVVIRDDLSRVLAGATLSSEPVAKIDDVVSDIKPVLDNGQCFWTGSLSIGQKIVISYSVKVNDGTEGLVIKNLASSFATPPGLPPIVPPTQQTVHPVPGFELLKTSDPASGSEVSVGSVINYSILGSNTGATALEPVNLKDDLSKVLGAASIVAKPSAIYIDADGTTKQAPAAVLDGNIMSWTGALEIGQRIKLSYAVKVNSANQSIANVVSGDATPPGGGIITPPPSTTTHEVPPTPTQTPDSGNGGEVDPSDPPSTGPGGSTTTPAPEKPATPSVTPDGGKDELPETGLVIGGSVVALAGLLLLAGLALVIVRRRRHA